MIYRSVIDLSDLVSLRSIALVCLSYLQGGTALFLQYTLCLEETDSVVSSFMHILPLLQVIMLSDGSKFKQNTLGTVYDVVNYNFVMKHILLKSLIHTLS